MIALIAHDQKKQEMREFVSRHAGFLQSYQLIATNGTADIVNDTFVRGELLKLNVTAAGHGPEGGDMIIGSFVVKQEVQAVFFFRDPLSSHPHEHDVSALIRVCDVHNVPLATNLATAELLVWSLKNKPHAS